MIDATLMTIGSTPIPLHLRHAEAIVGEVLTSPFPLAVVSGAAVETDGGFALPEPGECVFDVGNGPSRHRVTVLVVEPAALDMIPEYQSSGRSSVRSAAERRHVLRQYAHHGAVRTGRAEDMRTGPDWPAFVR